MCRDRSGQYEARDFADLCEARLRITSQLNRHHFFHLPGEDGSGVGKLYHRLAGLDRDVLRYLVVAPSLCGTSRARTQQIIGEMNRTTDSSRLSFVTECVRSLDEEANFHSYAPLHEVNMDPVAAIEALPDSELRDHLFSLLSSGHVYFDGYGRKIPRATYWGTPIQPFIRARPLVNFLDAVELIHEVGHAAAITHYKESTLHEAILPYRTELCELPALLFEELFIDLLRKQGSETALVGWFRRLQISRIVADLKRAKRVLQSQVLSDDILYEHAQIYSVGGYALAQCFVLELSRRGLIHELSLSDISPRRTFSELYNDVFDVEPDPKHLLFVSARAALR